MINTIKIENFKSIPALELDLGRVNVLIGENGCGKSNVLEAIAVGAEAVFGFNEAALAARGVRLPSSPLNLGCAFGKTEPRIAFEFSARTGCQQDSETLRSGLTFTQVKPAGKWSPDPPELLPETSEGLSSATDNSGAAWHKLAEKHAQRLKGLLDQFGLAGFSVYSASADKLRLLSPSESSSTLLGVGGQNLFIHLGALQRLDSAAFGRIKLRLKVIDWFEDLSVDEPVADRERMLAFVDRYLDPGQPKVNQRVSNEGILLLLFYLSLLDCDWTPRFLAIDNVEASLNPKACQALMHGVVQICKSRDKQVILTTHSPSVLDGLDLTDDEQRLFVVSRNRAGHTKLRRVQAPDPSSSATRLSEAFLRGYLGGLPKNF